MGVKQMARPLSSRIDDLIRSHQSLDQPIRIHGLLASALPHFVSRLIQEIPAPVLILFPHAEEAETARNDLLSWFSDGADLSQAPLLLPFPDWERSIFSAVSPGVRVGFERLAALGALANNATRSPKKPLIITSTLPASIRTTLSAERLREGSLSVAVGTQLELGRNAWVQRLVEIGYQSIDPVEDPGTFTVRGEIIDVFPPDSEFPYRIELFDDEVERIRLFDPETQLTVTHTEPLKEVSILPARESFVRQSERAEFRERVKSLADELGVPRLTRDPVLGTLQEGGYPDRSDAWTPFLPGQENGPNTLFSHLPKNTHVLLWDELGCLQSLEEFLSKLTEDAAHREERALIVPEVSSLYSFSQTVESSVRSKVRFYLDRITLRGAGAEDPEATEATAAETDAPKIKNQHELQLHDSSELKNLGSSDARLKRLDELFTLWRASALKVLVFCSNSSQRDRIAFLSRERGWVIDSVRVGNRSFSKGFRWAAEGLVVLTAEEVLGLAPSATPSASSARASAKSEKSSAQDWQGLQSLTDLQPDDGVVHVDHGVGRYCGMVRLSLGGAPSDFLQIEYAGKDKLYVPIYRLGAIQKYVGSGESLPLDKLGGQQFQKAKEKAKESAKKLAVNLIQLYAERKIRPGFKHRPRDEDFVAFESRFPFAETPDQLRAIDQVLADLQSGKVMDRLVCGDVGYGKTEVAIRAAYRAAADGKQVAVLVPTTILAHQHERSFRARFADEPFRVESISRFKSTKEQKQILAELKEGKVDVLIGTHRLLSKDVDFRDLGLLIIDEEHRFGVEHKEKLKALKTNTHVLTLTATPIPRTLHMSLSGLRDISLIHTAPVDRLPIRTYVAKHDDAVIQQAVEFELNRGGQVFFVHNRVQSIYTVAESVKKLVPRAEISVAHGQMAEGELESAILSFYEKRSNVLVCTAIIESGLDLPSANTILVNRADAFGLAQLYQIRGRVGRGQTRAYAYLFIPPEGALSGDAKKRLEVIQRFVDLGSGFQVASHDLEIRGGGELLGPHQSGHIAAIGFELYLELLDEAVRELQGKRSSEDAHAEEPEIKLPFSAYLPEEYVPSTQQRLNLYRKFSLTRHDSEIDQLEGELKDRFGPLPQEATNLLWLIRIKHLLKKTSVQQLTVGQGRATLTPSGRHPFDPAKLVSVLAASPQRFSVTTDGRLIVKISTDSPQAVLFSLEKVFSELGG